MLTLYGFDASILILQTIVIPGIIISLIGMSVNVMLHYALVIVAELGLEYVRKLLSVVKKMFES